LLLLWKGEIEMDYNKTMNLPVTDFPMRANLPEREPGVQKVWDERAVYRQVLDRAKEKNFPPFILHDGPPYANGHMHIGHALNKTLKDIVIKFRAMQGHYTPMVHGWDTHGLPIEQEVIKKLKVNRFEVGPVEFRKKCADYALQFQSIQEQEIRRLGVWGLWDSSYLTLRPQYEAKQIEVFGEMAAKGHIYKGLKPVYWCAACETALAEAEIEYDDHKSYSVYVKFAVRDGKGKLPEKDTYVVIWTTTPWTLPANVAICLHPEFEYTLLDNGQEKLLVAAEQADRFLEETGLEGYRSVGKRILGRELEGVVAKHPFIERDSLLILGEHVTIDTGTGCVHTAPGHGMEDYEVGRLYNLPIISPVTGKGTFSEEAGPYAGMKLEEANPVIIEDLRKSGHLIASGTLSHQYAHCWRCKRPVYFRATEQWFASIEGFREDALKAIKNVRWIPAWGEERISNMVAGRSDWCISRQRIWGVPIPIFYCEDCGTPLMTKESILSVRDHFAKEGSNAWYTHSAEELLPSGTKCAHEGCSGTKFRKEQDIMDVWFDSGSSHAAVLDTHPELSWPCDLYLEGSDQYRGWFQSSLLTAVATRGQAPYRAQLTHGFILDAQNRKMSKSEGNVIAPETIIKQFGADLLRLWVASSDYKADISVSLDIFKQISEVYRRIRNTARFLLANLNDFEPEKDCVPFNKLSELDRWALLRKEQLLRKVTKAYDEYEFHLVYHAIHNFCAVDMSALYLDIVKDRLYCLRKADPQRRSTQTVLYEILRDLAVMIAPILVHTAEEIWSYLPGSKESSVFLASWPKQNGCYLDENLEQKWSKLLEVREDVSKALELARAEKKIGSSLEARVVIYPTKEYVATVEAFKQQLAELFITSQAEVGATGTIPQDAHKGLQTGTIVAVFPAKGQKCQRCWTFSETVGQCQDHPEICERCSTAIE
jgi:isoleucyl-tRNA synthetase